MGCRDSAIVRNAAIQRFLGLSFGEEFRRKFFGDDCSLLEAKETAKTIQHLERAKFLKETAEQELKARLNGKEPERVSCDDINAGIVKASNEVKHICRETNVELFYSITKGKFNFLLLPPTQKFKGK